MAIQSVPLDIKINVIAPDAALVDTPAGILPVTRDALFGLFAAQIDFFGLALPAWAVILALLCGIALGVSQWVRRKVSGGVLTSTLPWLLLLALSFVLPNMQVSSADRRDARLEVVTNPSNIVWTVPQGTATTETFTGTTTVWSEASKGYELFVTGNVTGVNSPTHDIGFTITGGELTSPTQLTDVPVLVKDHDLPTTTGDASFFSFSVDIPRTLAIGSYAVSLQFTVESPDFPIIHSVSPQVGPEAGGTDITITGVNLISDDPSEPANILLGGQPCVVDTAASSAVAVVCQTPSHAAGPVDVKVTNPDSGIVDIPGQFTYLAAPSVASNSPARVKTNSGNVLTITGTNFDMVSVPNGNTVELNPTTGAAVTCVAVSSNATEIVCNAPAMASGAYTVTVETAGGSNTGGALTVQDAPTVTKLTPASGALAGGYTIDIEGTDFTGDGTTSVKVGSLVCAPVSFISSTKISCGVPGVGAPTTVDVIVTVDGIGSSDNTPADDYTYLNGPSIDPGPSGGGDVSVDDPANPNVPFGMHGSRPPVVDLDGK